MPKVKNFYKKASDFRSKIQKDTNISLDDKKLKLKFLDDLCKELPNSGEIPEKFRFEFEEPLKNDIIAEISTALSINFIYMNHIIKYDKQHHKIYCYFIFTNVKY